MARLEKSHVKEVILTDSIAQTQQQKLRNLKEVIITDSIAQPEYKKFSKLKILSTSRIFAETIKRVYTGESISDLFEI